MPVFPAFPTIPPPVAGIEWRQMTTFPSLVKRGLCVVLAALACGCANAPFGAGKSSGPVSLVPPPGVAAPAHTLSQPTASLQPSYTDADPRQLEAGLARSRQESQLMQDEIAALRDQLASTSTQLAQARATGRPIDATEAQQPAGIMAPAAMQAAMGQLSMPGVESRLDGNVVRIEVPSDRLFEPGSANLLPAGTALLTQVSTEVGRVYPGHFLGIEGHTSTEPLQNASWGSQHQLAVARASAVFDFFTTRTSLKQGQLFLVAHGPNHPVVSNATSAGRARNSRVEIVIYPERAGEGVDQPSGG